MRKINGTKRHFQKRKKTSISYELKISGLIIKKNMLKKIDFSGEVIKSFDIEKIKEIVLRQKRAYSCILVPLIFALWYFLGPFFS